MTVAFLSFSFCSFAGISNDQLLEKYTEALVQSEITFTDLDTVPWAITPITELAGRGIVAGMGNGLFAPQKTVSRAEFIKMITSACGIVNPDAHSSYSDVESGHWAYVYVSSAFEAGLTDIYPEGMLNPDTPVTREDICYMSAKAMNKCVTLQSTDNAISNPFTDEPEFSEYAIAPVYQLTGLGILNGRGDGSFSPKDSATRAESAKIIYNVLKIIEENY